MRGSQARRPPGICWPRVFRWSWPTPDSAVNTTGGPVAGELRGRGAASVSTTCSPTRGPHAPVWSSMSPGFAPAHPLVVAAADAGVPVWGEVELAWQIDQDGWFGAPHLARGDRNQR